MEQWVSQLTNGANNYLVVVNRDLDSAMTLTISVDTTKNFSKVSKDGTLTPLSSGTVIYTVDPGDIVILNWGDMGLTVSPESREVSTCAGGDVVCGEQYRWRYDELVGPGG